MPYFTIFKDQMLQFSGGFCFLSLSSSIKFARGFLTSSLEDTHKNLAAPPSTVSWYSLAGSETPHSLSASPQWNELGEEGKVKSMVSDKDSLTGPKKKAKIIITIK